VASMFADGIDVSAMSSKEGGGFEHALILYYPPPGLIASAYILSIGAGRNPGC
jgi:hypothetical protein